MAENETVKSGSGYGGRVFQIVISLILFAGFVVFLFVPDAFGDTSLWAMVLNVFKGEYADTEWLRFSLYGVVGFYAVLLVCTVISLFTKAGSALACNFVKAFVALAAFAFFAFALNKDLGASFSDILLDEKTFVAINAVTCSAALALLGTIVLNFAAYKGMGAVKFLFALFAAGFFVFAKGYTFLADTTFVELLGGLNLGEGIVSMITGYAFTVLAWAVLVNMALAVLTMMLPRTSVLDLIRSVIVFVLAALALVMGGVHGSFSTLFDNIGIVGMTGIALAQLIYAIIVVAVLHAKNKKKEAAEDAAEDNMFVVGANNQMAFRGLEAPAAASAAPASAAQEAPAAEPIRPEPQFTQDAAAANSAFEDAAQISIEEIAEETAKEEAEELAADSAKEEKDFDFEQAKFDGKFNRAYAEFAEQEEQKKRQEEQAEQQQQQQQQQQAQQQPFYGYGGYNYQQYQQTPPPYYGGYAQPQQQQQPYQQAQGYYNAGFVPDMFISSLTPAERDEFDRLFISRIYGENKRLPAYQIGGDNREFFTKIFVFMGRYRNVISEGLLEKIYNYSNSIK